MTQGSGGGEAISRNTPGPGGGTVARTGSGDVYAGRDGNVYKKSGDSWQKYDGSGNWNDVNRPETGVGSGQAGTQARDRAATGSGSTAATRPATTDRTTYDQLNRDARARTEGTQRTSAYGASQRSGGASTRPTTSYRPSGMSRGGGGRRR